jgi:hypothetical protein
VRLRIFRIMGVPHMWWWGTSLNLPFFDKRIVFKSSVYNSIIGFTIVLPCQILKPPPITKAKPAETLDTSRLRHSSRPRVFQSAWKVIDIHETSSYHFWPKMLMSSNSFCRSILFIIISRRSGSSTNGRNVWIRFRCNIRNRTSDKFCDGST